MLASLSGRPGSSPAGSLGLSVGKQERLRDSHEPWAVILPRPALSQVPRSSPFVGSRRLEKRFVSVRSARSKVEVLQAPGLPHGCSSANVTVTTMAGHTYRVP